MARRTTASILRKWLPLAAGLWFAAPLLNGAPGDFSVAGRNILNDGVDFEVRGLCYQPAAIGENPSDGFSFYGDYYYTDLNNRGIDEEYPDRWARDFANFSKMGVNVIRVYQWDPGLDHQAFMDTAASHGIYILVNRYIDPNADFQDASAEPGYQPSAAVLAYRNEWSAIANEIAGHPGVMGMLIGNETNWHTPSASDFFTAMNYLAGAVKAIAPDKLVSTAITDRLDQVAAYDASVPNFDFWAMQLYRGYSLGSFIGQYASTSSKPLVITEFGHDAYDGITDTEWPENAMLPANAMETLWNELRQDDAGPDIVSGGCIFEYADEWWKDTSSGQPAVQNPGPRWNGPFSDGQGNEEWWGIFRTVDDGSNIDRLEPRALFFRLAAMWNAPFETKFSTGMTNGDLQMSTSYPAHLRDQRIAVESSTDLANWVTVADNSNTPYLEPLFDSIQVESTEIDGSVLVSMSHDADAPGNPTPEPGNFNLIANGGFEQGWPENWATWGNATAVEAQTGSFSLQLAASGGFTVPSAFQTIPASPGDHFNLSGYLLTPVTLPDDATLGLLKIVFKDEGGNDLEPASISIGTAAAGPYFGAESVPVLDSGSPAGEWVFTEAQAVAPETAVSVSFFLLNIDESACTMYFDSIVANAPNIAPLSILAPQGPVLFFRFTNQGR